MTERDERYATREEAIARALADLEEGDILTIHDVECDGGDACTCGAVPSVPAART